MQAAAALEELNSSLGSLDRRLGSVERRPGDDIELKFEALGQVLTHRVEAVRAEVASRLEAAAGPEVEARLTAAENALKVERAARSAAEAAATQAEAQQLRLANSVAVAALLGAMAR